MDFFSDGNIYAVGKISRQGSGLPRIPGRDRRPILLHGLFERKKG